MIVLSANTASSQAVPVGAVSQVDTFAVVVTPRPVEDIKRDIDVVQATRARAKASLQTATDAVQKLETQIDAKKKEIDPLKRGKTPPTRKRRTWSSQPKGPDRGRGEDPRSSEGAKENALTPKWTPHRRSLTMPTWQ